MSTSTSSPSTHSPPSSSRPASGPTQPRTATVTLALAAITAVLWAASGPLPAPPPRLNELDVWATGLGPTTAAMALGRLVLLFVVGRWWLAMALATASRLATDRCRAERTAHLAELVAGRAVRGWVRGMLGFGAATTFLVPLPAVAAEHPGESVEVPLLEQIEEAPPHGGRKGAGPTAPTTDREPEPRATSEAPRLVLIEPDVVDEAPAATVETSTTGVSPTVSRAGRDGRDAPEGSNVPVGGPSPAEPTVGDAPAPSGGDPARSPSPSDAATPTTPAQDPVGLSPWTIGPGEHLWHVAEATAFEVAPGADPAEVVEYHRRLIEVNRRRLPIPENPDLVFPGNVILRPTWGG